MSQDPDAPILNGIKLLRVREHLMGYSQGTNSVGLILGNAVNSLVSCALDTRVPIEIRTSVIKELIQIEIQVIENIQNSIADLRKLVPSLQALHLDVSAELTKLNNIESRVETINIKFQKLSNDYKANVTNIGILGPLALLVGELIIINKDLSTFCQGIDKRVQDALTMVAQLVDPDKFKLLYKLFMEKL